MPGPIYTHKSRRYLPHWKREDDSAVYWITFRMADSIPREKLETIRKERERFLLENPKPWPTEIFATYQKRFSDRMEEWQDAGHGACHLADSGIRQHLVDCMLLFDGIRHDIVSSVIMPNHVHLLTRPRDGHPVDQLLKGIKGTSARKINHALGTTGNRFWMEESYDHIVRSREELALLRGYIVSNPKSLPRDSFWLLDRDPTFQLISDPQHPVLFARDSSPPTE